MLYFSIFDIVLDDYILQEIYYKICLDLIFLLRHFNEKYSLLHGLKILSAKAVGAVNVLMLHCVCVRERKTKETVFLSIHMILFGQLYFKADTGRAKSGAACQCIIISLWMCLLKHLIYSAS